MNNETKQDIWSLAVWLVGCGLITWVIWLCRDLMG